MTVMEPPSLTAPIGVLAKSVDEIPLSPSVRQLRQAYADPDQREYLKIRAAFEQAHGPVVDEYYAHNVAASAVLFDLGDCYKIRLDYDSSQAPAVLTAELGRIRLEELESSALLSGAAQQVFAQKVFVIIVRLFAAWDASRFLVNGDGRARPNG